MATLLDPSDPEVRAAATSSREIFSRPGARPVLERLDAVLKRSAATPPVAAATASAAGNIAPANA